MEILLMLHCTSSHNRDIAQAYPMDARLQVHLRNLLELPGISRLQRSGLLRGNEGFGE